MTIIVVIIPEIYRKTLLLKLQSIFCMGFITYVPVTLSFIGFILTYILLFLIIPKIYISRGTSKESSKPHISTVILFILISIITLSGEVIYLRGRETVDAGDIVQQYIIKGQDEIISVNELNMLKDIDLSHIRNGFYARHGVIFEGDFYERYAWYNPTIDRSDFSWDKFNFYEQTNINNILGIESKRREHNSLFTTN